MTGLSVTTDGRGVVTFLLDRPEVRNAFDPSLISDIRDGIADLPRDCRVLVLKGAGPVFSAGADLNWMKAMSSYSQSENLSDADALHEMFMALDECRVPVVGQIHGAAMAGATGLVACCDVAVASEGTLFAFTEVRLGLLPAVISPFVVRKVGYSFARAAFMSAERFDAQRALQVGLIHKVVALEDLESEVQLVVSALLMGAPVATRKARSLVNDVVDRSPESVAKLTAQAIADARVSDEGIEGISSFLEKRSPVWAPEKP